MILFRKDQLAEEAHSKMLEYHQAILQNQAKNILPKTNQEKLGFNKYIDSKILR